MPRKRNLHKVSSQTVKRSQDLAKTKQQKLPRSARSSARQKLGKKERNFESDLLLQMKEKGYNGKQFVDHLKAGVEDRLHKRGKPPRMVRYFFYCAWAHALLRNKVGPNDANYTYPQMVLEFLRDIAPGDIKGEIREDAYLVQIEEFCEALNINKLD